MESSAAGSGFGFGGVVLIAVIVFYIAAIWKVCTKAGQPGWGVLIPIYNIYLMCKIAGKPGWWTLLLLVPLVNIVIGLLLPLAIADKFGKGVGFGIGLILLPFIFFPILGFGDAQYEGGTQYAGRAPAGAPTFPGRRAPLPNPGRLQH